MNPVSIQVYHNTAVFASNHWLILTEESGFVCEMYVVIMV